ncbi:tripartite motif-containing protein 16-like, partial [Plectropomus leopardus]|uniref:tripartite motif-containing protein 16-like n=1 Tax=Plectropomus leopardus TaxID=160734 RepID=UPI001C4AC482
VSYCEQHLQPHYESPAFKKHKLVEASPKLQENICTRHNEVMKIFCRTDQRCICYLCSMDEHKGHNMVSAAAEMAEKQKELGASRQKILQRIQSREKDVRVLQREEKVISHSADKAVEDSKKMSAELIRLIKKRSSDVKQQIRSRQEAEVSRVKTLQVKLKQELDGLRRNNAELEKLLHTEDHTLFLQNYVSLSNLADSEDSSSINNRPVQYFEDVTVAVSKGREKLQDTLGVIWNSISQKVINVDVLLPQNPQTRADFSLYALDKDYFRLDRNTASMQILLSEENCKATCMKDEQSYPNHPERFMGKSQVLCRQPLMIGHHYWEVEWSGLGVSIAVAYRDIARTGPKSKFGDNDKSWALECVKKNDLIIYDFKHNSHKKSITKPPSSKIGVYLSHRAGMLCFYSVSGTTMTLLHRVQTTFTQPLHAGLGVYYYGAAAEFCDVK